jgi:pimeloyl-ACP methyl ester carboxylesterase
MLAGAPVTVRSLDIAGVTTSVLEGGEGPPVVLLHGAIECGGALWAPVLPQLATDYRLIVPDFPGLGESAPFPRIDLDSFSIWFRGLLEQLGVEQPTLVAHSLIGTLATRFAARHSSLVSRLVLYAAPAAVGRYRMPLGLKSRALRFALRPTVANLERFQQFALLDRDSTRDRDPEWFDAFSAYTVARARQRDVKTTMRRLIASQTKGVPGDDLMRIDVPTALLWGRDDRMAPIRIAESAAALHRWPLSIVEGTGHVPHIEQPQLFVDALREACAGLQS